MNKKIICRKCKKEVELESIVCIDCYNGIINTAVNGLDDILKKHGGK